MGIKDFGRQARVGDSPDKKGGHNAGSGDQKESAEEKVAYLIPIRCECGALLGRRTYSNGYLNDYESDGKFLYPEIDDDGMTTAVIMKCRSCKHFVEVDVGGQSEESPEGT